MRQDPALRRPLVQALASLLCACAATASAHDTWFERLAAPASPGATLALGTGNRFPIHELQVQAMTLQQSGCRRPTSDRTLPLKAQRETGRALILRTPQLRRAPLSCWAQQQAFDVEIQPATVEVYFREINASPQVRAAWAEMQERGVAWKERFAKHARIELGGTRSSPAVARPTGMAMDVLLDSGLQPHRPGDTLRFQVLRDGQPLAGQAMEFRNDLSPIGFWRTTDAQGRVSFEPPLAANWVLRGTDLRLSDTRPDTWDSRFVTLVFQVGDARPAGGP